MSRDQNVHVERFGAGREERKSAPLKKKKLRATHSAEE